MTYHDHFQFLYLGKLEKPQVVKLIIIIIIIIVINCHAQEMIIVTTCINVTSMIITSREDD